MGKSIIAFNQASMGSPTRKLRATPCTSVSKKSLIGPDASRGELTISVPQTDTGGLVEYTKAIGRKRFKELGKTAGRNLWEMPYLDLIVGVAAKDAYRLFN